MFHPDAQHLIDVWFRLDTRGGVPDRAALDPVSLGRRLPQTFVAERQGETARFRLVGGGIERLHGGALTGMDWDGLWIPDSRPLLALSVVQAFREARPVVLVADAGASDTTIEIAMAPLRSPTGCVDLLLGLYAFTTTAATALTDIGPLTARLSVGVGSARRAPLQLAAMDGRRIA